ncbi:hypothetical protein ACF3MZ_16050 [Paenibacillaceae bacterium WGS1546]|uniref:hypothetical protein n=1 Tax=Cohnella sp. WGS1546 TaxID=3366810 RepID=UPI00372D5EA0
MAARLMIHDYIAYKIWESEQWERERSLRLRNGFPDESGRRAGEDEYHPRNWLLLALLNAIPAIDHRLALLQPWAVRTEDPLLNT